MELTVVCVRGGVLLAHKTVCLQCVSRFQTDTSLFPCTADMTHDCSVGWHIRRRIRVPAAHKQTYIIYSLYISEIQALWGNNTKQHLILLNSIADDHKRISSCTES